MAGPRSCAKLVSRWMGSPEWNETDLHGDLGMTSFSPRPRVTILDVARAAQVSRQTVSNVVNHPDRVREDTRTRVQAEIDRLGYRASRAAQSLRAQRAGAVGIELNARAENEVDDVAYPFLVQLSVAAPRHGSHIVPFALAAGPSTVAGYENLIRTHLVDAFILSDTHAGDPRPGFLTRAGVPFATFGRVWDDESFTAWADVDGRAGTSAAVDHLADAGYTTIGFLGWPAGSREVGDDRRAGWYGALARHGLHGGDFSTESAQNSAAAYVAARPLVSSIGAGGALVCASDALASGAMRAAESLGLTIGRDFGVVGFEDSVTARVHGISSLAQPLEQIADHLLGVLGTQLALGQRPAAGDLFVPRLIPRGSSSRS